MGDIEYKTDAIIPVQDFQELLTGSTLGERRPVEDLECLRGMIENSNLIISAWDGDKLVGIARSVTDFHYACYLSDLAVDQAYQRQGIGVKLQQLTQDRLGPRCTLILIAAPAASDYYPSIGFEHCPRCWVLPRDRKCGVTADVPNEG